MMFGATGSYVGPGFHVSGDKLFDRNIGFGFKVIWRQWFCLKQLMEESALIPVKTMYYHDYFNSALHRTYVTQLAPFKGMLYVLCIALFFFEAAWAQKTDIIALKNGDRITGEVKELKFGKLEYSTDDVETIFIEWDKVIPMRPSSILQAFAS